MMCDGVGMGLLGLMSERVMMMRVYSMHKWTDTNTYVLPV